MHFGKMCLLDKKGIIETISMLEFHRDLLEILEEMISRYHMHGDVLNVLTVNNLVIVVKTERVPIISVIMTRYQIRDLYDRK